MESSTSPQKPDSITAKVLQILNVKNPLICSNAACDLVAELLKALTDEDSTVRGWAAWALAQIGTETVVTDLLQQLNHQNSDVRAWAIWALGEINSEAAMKGLIEALNHQDSGVRWRAVAGLAKNHAKAAIEKLVEARNDQDFYVRWRVALALGQLNNIPHPSIKSRIADVLAKIGSEAAVAGLIETMQKEDSIVRDNAVWTLGQIGSESAINGLIVALKHSDAHVRAKAASGLGRIRAPEAVSLLIQALKDEDYYVRWRAASALGKIGDEAAIVSLVQALDDEHAAVRSAAVYALGNIGNDAAISGLQKALNDRVDLVRTRAKESLKKIASKISITSDLLATDEESDRISFTPQQDKLPTLFITSCTEASEHLLCSTRGRLIKHLISIGSPKVPLPEGYAKVPHRLRLEFHDIDTPICDPEYVLATPEDIIKVLKFVSEIERFDGHLLVHCQAGVSRSAAVALTICSQLLGAGEEEKALAYVLAARPKAMPNLWVVELADTALDRAGKLLQVVQKHRDGFLNNLSNYNAP